MIDLENPQDQMFSFFPHLWCHINRTDDRLNELKFQINVYFDKHLKIIQSLNVINMLFSNFILTCLNLYLFIFSKSRLVNSCLQFNRILVQSIYRERILYEIINFHNGYSDKGSGLRISDSKVFSSARMTFDFFLQFL